MLTGAFLLSVNVIGTCIASLNVYNDVAVMQYGVLLIPNVLGYTLLLVGFAGYLDVFRVIKNRISTKK